LAFLQRKQVITLAAIWQKINEMLIDQFFVDNLRLSVACCLVSFVPDEPATSLFDVGRLRFPFFLRRFFSSAFRNKNASTPHHTAYSVTSSESVSRAGRLAENGGVSATRFV